MDLANFYPVIAWAAEFTRLRRQDHPALHHQITDAPSKAYTESERLSDNSVACVVRYGSDMEFIPCDAPPPPPRRRWVGLRSKRPKSPPPDPPCLRRWWPSCPTLSERMYLRRRISREGHLLPLLIGMGTALLLEVYSVNNNRSSPPCLHFSGKPIHDFGIYYGSIRIDRDRTLAYAQNNLKGGPVSEMPDRYQEPQNHFWLYFETEDLDEEIFLDIGLFVYGYRDQVVNSRNYLSRRDFAEAKQRVMNLLDVPKEHEFFVDPYAAVHFSDKNIQDSMYRSGVLLHKKKERFSILRNLDLLAGLESMTRDGSSPTRWQFTRKSIVTLADFMMRVDEEAMTVGGDITLEMKILLDTVMNGTRIIHNAMKKDLPRPWIENCQWELGINTR